MTRTMSPQVRAIAQKIHEALLERKRIRITTTAGHISGPGHVLITYGEFAFRFQADSPESPSRFMTTHEVGEVEAV